MLYCAVSENIQIPPQKGMGFPGGFCKAKKFKEMYSAQLKFPEGWGGKAVFEKIPSVGEVWIYFWNYMLLSDLFLLDFVILCPCHMSRANKYIAIIILKCEVLIFKN